MQHDLLHSPMAIILGFRDVAGNSEAVWALGLVRSKHVQVRFRLAALEILRGVSSYLQAQN